MAAASILQPGVSAETRVMQSRLQRLAFESELQAKPVTPPQIADLAQLVEKIDWAPGDRELVVQALNAKATGESKRKVRRPMQDYMAFLNYLRNRVWQLLEDKAITAQSKMDSIAIALVDMNCINPDEHTLKLATSLYLCAVFGVDRACSMSIDEKGRVKAMFKTCHKRHARKKTVTPAEYETKLNLPQELRVSNAALFAQIMPNEDLVPTISSADVMYVSNTFNCRNNTASSSIVVAPRAPQQDTVAAGMMDCMKQCMQMMMSARMDFDGGRRVADADVPITFLSSGSGQPLSLGRQTIGSERLRNTLGLPPQGASRPAMQDPGQQIDQGTSALALRDARLQIAPSPAQTQIAPSLAQMNFRAR